MIDEILPAEVAAVEAFGDPPGAVALPAELPAVEGAVDKRRREFATVRVCAREAMSRLGLPPEPVPRGPGGAPCWPRGVVGSMTHCRGYRAAALAPARLILAVGIDAEPHEPMSAPAFHAIARPEERARLQSLAAAGPRIHWDRLLFSAKESVYKAWFPLTERRLGFAQVSVAFEPRLCTFTARLLVPASHQGRPLRAFSGRWLVREGLLLTAIAVPAATPFAGDLDLPERATTSPAASAAALGRSADT